MPDLSNPHRLEGLPTLGSPAIGLAPVAVVERSPTGLAVLPQVAVKIATVLVGLAAQWIPVVLAAIGVTYLTFIYGRLPYIALTLAFSFGLYGLVKKLSPLGSLYGLTPMLIALIAMVAMSVLNYTAKALPTGLEPKKRKENPEATQMLVDAIDKRNLSYFKTLLTMDFDVDLPSPDGMTPLMKAAQKGEFKMVQMLIRRGASALIEGPSGRASDVALKGNFPKVAEFLTRVETVHAAEAEKHQSKQPEAAPAIA